MSLTKRIERGELRAAAVLGQVGSGHDADRGRNAMPMIGQDQAADDRVGDAAALGCRGRASSG